MDDGPPWGPGQIEEIEPNDVAAQDVSELRSGYAITGTAGACGGSGLWDGADIDRFAFTVPSGRVRNFRLAMWRGDLDLELRSADGLPVDESSRSGIEEEAIVASLDPEMRWEIVVRCWMGDGAAWRLDVLDGE